MISMIILEVLGIIEVAWSQLVAKVAKIEKSGQISEGVPVNVQGCTGTPHQRPTCTGTGPTYTDTCQQKATCTGTCPGCTGTCEPKMPKMLCFCVIKPEFVH